MRRRFAIAAGVFSALIASTTLADTWVTAGIERGQQVAISLDGVPADKATPFGAVLATFPRNWPSNSHDYTLRLAEFDCRARTRTVKTLIRYSSRRDPVTTALNERPTGDADPAVAAQLNLLCGSTDVQRRQTFNHLGEFSQSLRR